LVSGSTRNPHPPPPRRNRPSLTARRGAAVFLTLVLSQGLAACGQDYCGAVTDHQSALTDVTASGSPSALLEALPIFRDLSEQAPDDVRDDWRTFLDPLEELDDALRDAGVDPASYAADDLPAGISAGERTRIESAGAALADPAVARAFDSVQQQAKDVCHTPLSL
jgi:hypothetical protein